MKRWWMSWIVPEKDYRPLTYPPNDAILGWWCTGEDAQDRFILYGLVQAESLEAAEAAVLQDWPGIEWRFQELTGPDLAFTDRFHLSDWITERLVGPVRPPTKD
jgi:hypothetical protein